MNTFRNNEDIKIAGGPATIPVLYREFQGSEDPDFRTVCQLEYGRSESLRGITMLVSRKVNCEVLACKTYDCRNDSGQIDFSNCKRVDDEIEVLATICEDDNVAVFEKEYTYNTGTSEMRIYMRHYGGGDLYPVLVEQSQTRYYIFPPIALRIALGIAKGIRSCHCRNIVHGNIHPKSVFLAMEWSSSELCWRAVNNLQLPDELQTEYYALKEYVRQDWHNAVVLGGFEYSFFLNNPKHFKAPQGQHTANECLGDRPPSQASDIFSFGQLLCSLFSGKRPPQKYLLSYYPSSLSSIVKNCMDLDPPSRPSIDKVIIALEDALQEVLVRYDEQKVIDYAMANFKDWTPMPTVRELSPASIKASSVNSYDVVTPTSGQSVTGDSVISTTSAFAHPTPFSDQWPEEWSASPKKLSDSFHV